MLDGITIDLRENFIRDEVVILAGGREVAREEGVTTRTQIGLAKSVTLPLDASLMRLEVFLPMLGVRGEVDIPDARPLWVGVSLTPSRDRLQFIVQTDPFGYV